MLAFKPHLLLLIGGFVLVVIGTVLDGSNANALIAVGLALTMIGIVTHRRKELADAR